MPRRGRLGPNLALAIVSLIATVSVLEGAAHLALGRLAPVLQRERYYRQALPLVNRPTPYWFEPGIGGTLPESKEEGEIRVLVFGESSVAGVPYGSLASAPAILHDIL